jgi:hypothetical protein
VLVRRLGAMTLCSVVLLATTALWPAQGALPSESQWLSDVNQAMSGSRVYVGHRVAHGSGLAVNLDIDNTSLASHYDYGAAVGVVLRLASYARSRGVTLLFNTGRLRGDGRMVRAARQLRAAGYAVTEVCGRSTADEGLAESKQRCRRHFVAEGYTIIANVGNRSTDFAGGDYERAFRLPNYGNQLT